MTKEQFIKRWKPSHMLIADFESVIATEIAKAKEVKLEDPKPQPALNPIAEAYERGEKIRAKFWKKGTWARKNSDTHAVDEKKVLWDVGMWDFKTKPEKWELYTEPTDQVTDQEPEQVTDHEQPVEPKQSSNQVILNNSFDRERFEAMFRAVVASGRYEIKTTEQLLAKLDAFYASKEGGNNG